MDMAHFDLDDSNTFEYSNEQGKEWGKFECLKVAHSLEALPIRHSSKWMYNGYYCFYQGIFSKIQDFTTESFTFYSCGYPERPLRSVRGSQLELEERRWLQRFLLRNALTQVTQQCARAAGALAMHTTTHLPPKQQHSMNGTAAEFKSSHPPLGAKYSWGRLMCKRSFEGIVASKEILLV